MSAKPPNMLYVYPKFTSFVKRDVEILEKDFNIILFEFNPSKKWLIPISFLRQLLFLIKNTYKSTIFLSYFGGYHSLLPGLFAVFFKKKHVIIVGGTDAVSFPSIRYGNFNNKLIGLLTDWSYRLCSVIVPVHKTLEYCDYIYTNDDFPAQGIKFHCKNLETRIVNVNNGYRKNIWKNKKQVRIPKSFLTVASTFTFSTYKRKGVDVIIEVANYFPECKFTIIGADSNNILDNIPSNITLCPPVPFEELENIYNVHQYYFQLSICEGLPNALCEAMLCGCVPIGSSAMSIPEVIGNSGFIVKERGVENTVQVIKKALTCDWLIKSELARKRIVENYPIEKRVIEFKELMKSL